MWYLGCESLCLLMGDFENEVTTFIIIHRDSKHKIIDD